MPRKKKALAAPVEAPADTSFNPVELEQPTEEPNHASRHQPRKQEGQSHAEAVGRRERQPHYTHPYSDRVIGAHRLEHRDPYYSIIRFDEKPSEEVRAKLREAGFEWVQRNMEWKRYINFETKEQDRESARRTFDEVCKMIRTERGINHEYGGVA